MSEIQTTNEAQGTNSQADYNFIKDLESKKISHNDLTDAQLDQLLSADVIDEENDFEDLLEEFDITPTDVMLELFQSGRLDEELLITLMGENYD